MSIKAKIYQDDDFKTEIEADAILLTTDSRCLLTGTVDNEILMRLASNSVASIYDISGDIGARLDNMVKYLSYVCYNAYLIMSNQRVADVYQDINVDGIEYQVDKDAYLQQMIEQKLSDLFDRLEGEDDLEDGD